MKTFFLTIALFLVTTFSFSQQLTFKKGNVYNSEDKKLNTPEVRELLASNPEALEKFNAGISKGSVGGFLVGFGIGLTIGDLVGALFTTKEYPSALTYVGAASFVIGLPISIGTNKKIKSAIALYNEKKTVFNIEKTTIIANQNGIGMRVNF
ncbi:hypothetical protein [Flavobacterium sp.]|uniref:hypothetical protein n=1 Tax=Flavobacterium sp. TaxID=239 RepID=UPI00286DFC8D|nr:hypothetical protein [Flavobacterium sp.]